MKYLMTAIVAVFAAGTSGAMADGHIAKGESDFKKCKACHTLANGDDVIIKGGRTGPNLYGMVGRTAGTVEGYKYGDSIVAAGEAGLVWTQDLLVEYVADPKGFLKEFTGDSGARSKMSFKLKNGENIAAYLGTLGAVAEAEATGN